MFLIVNQEGSFWDPSIKKFVENPLEGELYEQRQAYLVCQSIVGEYGDMVLDVRPMRFYIHPSEQTIWNEQSQEQARSEGWQIVVNESHEGSKWKPESTYAFTLCSDDEAGKYLFEKDIYQHVRLKAVVDESPLHINALKFLKAYSPDNYREVMTSINDDFYSNWLKQKDEENINAIVQCFVNGFKLPLITHLLPIPANANPMHHDAVSMGTALSDEWMILHEGPCGDRKMQYMKLYNLKTGQVIKLDFRPKNF